MRVYNSIVATGKVPFEYDFIVVNKVLLIGALIMLLLILMMKLNVYKQFVRLLPINDT